MAFTANDVLALARAGYNSQQIALLSRAAADQQPAQQQPAQQPAQKTEPTPGDIMQQLQQLTGAIQMQNQLNSQQPQSETVEDILATVLEP